MYTIAVTTFQGLALLEKTTQDFFAKKDTWKMYLEGDLITRNFRAATPDLKDLASINDFHTAVKDYVDRNFGITSDPIPWMDAINETVEGEDDPPPPPRLEKNYERVGNMLRRKS